MLLPYRAVQHFHTLLFALVARPGRVALELGHQTCGESCSDGLFTRWADEGAKVFLEPLYRNLVDFAQQLVGRIAPMVDGEEHFHALLRDMCKDGRLFPGPPTPVIEASGEENKNTPRAKLPPRLRRLVDAHA